MSMSFPINRFRGPYNFLSNFWVTPIVYKGVMFPSSENAYQAAKFPKEQWYLFTDITPYQSKVLAYSSALQPFRNMNFDEIKIDVMAELLAIKFAEGTDLALLLIETYPRKLIEGNNHGDTFWGTVDGEGSNHLGELLMKRRQLLVDIMGR